MGSQKLHIWDNMKIPASLLLLVSAASAQNPCAYTCQDTGACQVRYVGPSRPGHTMGSCFPASFGGECSGQRPRRPVSTVGSPPADRPAVGEPRQRPSDSGNCQYDCQGWPYSQCEMSFSSGFRSGSATCINPYFRRGSTAKFSNYPNCATVPQGCERCDDYCARQDGRRDRFDY